MTDSDYNLLIVSDLHLSEGRNRFTNKISLNEDFFFDEEFARFLAYHASHDAGSRKWHLLINGDFLDFLQVVSTAPDEEFDTFVAQMAGGSNPLAIHRHEREHPFGFGTGCYETAYKVWTIMTGHWIFFEALAEFIVHGNVVSIGRGNHDVELFYPEVQAAIRAKLRRLYERKLARTNAKNKVERMREYDARIISGLRFIDWFYFEKDQIWVEHGNQYDELNTFKYWLYPLLPRAAGTGIDLPWGSFFVRYLFNGVETEEPFADNVKPSTKFVSWFLKNHPSLALRFVFHNGSHMLSRMARAWRPIPENDYAESKAIHDQRRTDLATAAQIEPGKLACIDESRAKSVMKEAEGKWGKISTLVRAGAVIPMAFVAILLLAVGLCLLALGILATLTPVSVQPIAMTVVRWTAVTLLIPIAVACAAWLIVVLFGLYRHPYKEVPVDPLLAPARRLAEALNVRYVVMGHTHDAALEQLGAGREYFNTGTWTKVFSEEERLLREENEFVFVQALRSADGSLRLKLMKWIDGASECRLVKLFDRSTFTVAQPERKYAAAAD